MEKFDKIPGQPTYNFINPGQRFVTLANAIIGQIGQKQHLNNENIRPQVAQWPMDDSAYYYRLEKKDYGNRGGIHYFLEHFIPGMSPDPIARYKLTAWGVSSVSAIKKIDYSDREIKQTPSEQKDTERIAIAILAQSATREDGQFIKEAFDKQFDELVGAIILSDAAVQNDESLPELNADMARNSAANYMGHLMCIAAEEYLVRDTSSQARSTSMNQAPKKTNDVDSTEYFMTNAVYVANRIGKQWRNTVEPDM